MCVCALNDSFDVYCLQLIKTNAHGEHASRFSELFAMRQIEFEKIMACVGIQHAHVLYISLCVLAFI